MGCDMGTRDSVNLSETKDLFGAPTPSHQPTTLQGGKDNPKGGKKVLWGGLTLDVSDRSNEANFKTQTTRNFYTYFM